jgi:hypothetical protein
MALAGFRVDRHCPHLIYRGRTSPQPLDVAPSGGSWNSRAVNVESAKRGLAG